MKSKLQTLLGYVREFETKSVMTDGKVLTCRICHTTVSHSQNHKFNNTYLQINTQHHYPRLIQLLKSLLTTNYLI